MSNLHSVSPCCGCAAPCSQAKSPGGVDRREFMAGMGALTAGALAMGAMEARAARGSADSGHKPPVRLPLRIQPVLTYSLPQRRNQTSWRGWGTIQTEEGVSEEKNRIGGELAAMQKNADFPLEVLPLAAVSNPEQAKGVARGDHDVLLMYAAGSGTNTLEALSDPDKWTIMFVRHRSGPVYLWYEIAHNRYLRKTVDEYGQPGVGPKDVVVDSHDEVLWRLRALSGLKNTLGKRIVALGGPSGWGIGGQTAPDRTRELWKMDIVDVPYDDLGKMIQAARGNDSLVKRCRNDAEAYLKDDGISLETGKDFVTNAFLLTEVFHDLMDQADTDAFTINHCMGTVMGISETTACLPLTLMNDAGYMAFCESDFVVVPSGVLLHYISGLPVFLNDPTYPHDNTVTIAHCTAPRRMDGVKQEPARILTHFESDYGAAPKVEMTLGQKMTIIDPDFASQRWLGFEAEVIDNPFLDICRSQVDVHFDADCDKLNEETRGFHWMASYGNYLKETGYALGKVGVDWMHLT